MVWNKIALSGALLLVFCVYVNGQPNKLTPKTGDIITDLPLNNVQYGSFDSSSIAALRGQWLILDFWSAGCVSCVASFPKINKVINNIKGNYQFLLVGREHRLIRSIYEKYRAYYDLRIPVMYDTVLFEYFQIGAVPTMVIIDTLGRIHAITHSAELSEEKLKALISGGDGQFQELAVILRLPEKTTPAEPVIWSSSVERYMRKEIPLGTNFFQPYHWRNSNKHGIEIYAATLQLLYMTAYFGRDDWFPEDSTRYGILWPTVVTEGMTSEELAQNDLAPGKYFNYKLVTADTLCPSATLQEKMRADLNSMFPFYAGIERRKMPCYYLKVSTTAAKRLSTKGGKSNLLTTAETTTGLHLVNTPVRELVSWISRYHRQAPPIVNKTGLRKNIDIRFDAVMNDFEDIQRELKQQGFRMIKRRKKMFVIVVRPKQHYEINGMPSTFDPQ